VAGLWYAQFYKLELHSGSFFFLQQTFAPDGLNRLSHQVDDELRQAVDCYNDTPLMHVHCAVIDLQQAVVVEVGESGPLTRISMRLLAYLNMSRYLWIKLRFSTVSTCM